ncbi:MAG: class II aldolase/adducin family protein [Spirochaetaceae bacterium]|jgi:rhamnose utilization protein RhaD (predicted bifunctional aldolase and dehydrogenase)|nr:class II aldolase/adducin family protein [Spirochaetaceae bacterium]
MSLQELVEISRYYGGNPEYVIAGGGNTSWKDGGDLYVKGSGTALGEIDADGFVKMDRAALARIWTRQYPESEDEREAAVLADMMTARAAGEEKKRPSVETLLHDILPFLYVVHTHPAVVNGVTCSMEGESAVRRLFDETGYAPPVWIPVTNPGYVLSAIVKEKMDGYLKKHGRPAEIIFLQNHGIFAGANSVSYMKDLYRRVIGCITAEIRRKPDFSGGTGEFGSSAKMFAPLTEVLSAHYPDGLFIRFDRNNEIARLVRNRASFGAVSSAFTPDHIVYAGSDPLFIDNTVTKLPAETIGGAIIDAVSRHTARTGRPPKIIAVEDVGVYSIGPHKKAADLAFALFEDAVTVAVYSEAFGGPRFMPLDKIDFINNWEVERYRSSISVKQ